MVFNFKTKLADITIDTTPEEFNKLDVDALLSVLSILENNNNFDDFEQLSDSIVKTNYDNDDIVPSRTLDAIKKINDNTEKESFDKKEKFVNELSWRMTEKNMLPIKIIRDDTPVDEVSNTIKSTSEQFFDWMMRFDKRRDLYNTIHMTYVGYVPTMFNGEYAEYNDRIRQVVNTIIAVGILTSCIDNTSYR